MPIKELPKYPATARQYEALLRSIYKNVSFIDKSRLIGNLEVVRDQYKKKYGVYTQPCIHHITGAGMALKNKEFIPLCHHHHQGGEGIHTLGTKVWEEKYGRQRDLLREFKEVCQEKLN